MGERLADMCTTSCITVGDPKAIRSEAEIDSPLREVMREHRHAYRSEFSPWNFEDLLWCRAITWADYPPIKDSRSLESNLAACVWDDFSNLEGGCYRMWRVRKLMKYMSIVRPRYKMMEPLTADLQFGRTVYVAFHEPYDIDNRGRPFVMIVG